MNGKRTRVYLRRLAAALAIAVMLPLVVGGVMLRQPLDTASLLAACPSPELQDRNARLLYPLRNAAGMWCFPRKLAAFSPRLTEATIAVEDQRFYAHPGVDPVAVLRALGQNLAAVGVRSGASTITMQTVKLARGGPRTLRAKAAQAWHALRLDQHAEKEAILASYLNNAPYGYNLVGAEAAARRYFGKPAAELTLPEAALLAGMPKAPAHYNPLEHPAAAKARRNHVLNRMYAEGFISREEHTAACAAELGTRWHDFPDLAPHYAQAHTGQMRAAGVIRLTLDSARQTAVRRILRRALNRFEGTVTNAAAVVVDVAAGEVIARVAGADFLHAPGGQVDLCAAPRSPGSTLKPFAYAAALDANVLYPTETLYDGPLDYGAYRPGNFDGRFRGRVSAREALAASLNVPAIAVLERAGTARLAALLHDAGLDTVQPGDHRYGLGLVLGNCEARLDELAAAYTMIAGLGVYRPLQQRRDRASTGGKRLLTPGTCHEIYRMLEQPFPEEVYPDTPRRRGYRPRVCWKTGTSTGYHDAWTFAFNRHYVVGVWLGNSGGQPSRRLVGSAAALPVAATIFRDLPPRTTPAWPEGSGAWQRVTVCTETGLPASRWCPHTAEKKLAARHYLHRRCDVHRPDGAGGVAAYWPGSARTWDLAAVDVKSGAGPGPAAGTDGKKALVIETPTPRAEYVLTGEPAGDVIRLAASGDDRGTVHWYVNGRYVGRGGPDQSVVWPLQPGRHVAACLTGDGRSAESRFTVSAPGNTREFMR
ncbi:MAG: penicillin-binding protein 1C [Candidatus Hydrogenedentota bacterium]